MASSSSSYGSFNNNTENNIKLSTEAIKQLIGDNEDGERNDDNNNNKEDDDESTLLPINLKGTSIDQNTSNDKTANGKADDNTSTNNNNNNNTKSTPEELVVKYREKLKRLAAKYKLVIKDRDEMQSKYEKYISELRNKLKRSNEAGKKYKAEYQDLLAKQKKTNNKNNHITASSLISNTMRNPLDLVKAAVSQTTSSSATNNDETSNTKQRNIKNDSNKNDSNGMKEKMQEISAKNNELNELVEQLNTDMKKLKDENIELKRSIDNDQKDHSSKIENLDNEIVGLKEVLAKKDTNINKLKKTVRVKMEQLDDFEKTKGRLKDLESNLLTNVDNLARVTNDKQMLEDQLKQVYKSKNELEQALQDMREKLSKQHKSKSKILSEAKLKADQQIDDKQIELDIARKEMLSMLNTTEAAEDRARILLEGKKKLQKKYTELEHQFQGLQQQLQEQQSDKSNHPVLSTPTKSNDFNGNNSNDESPLGTPQSTPRSIYNNNNEKEMYINDHAIDNIRKKHQKALQKISEQRSRFLQAAAEKAGFQSEMSALSARVKLQEIQLEQMRKSQEEKEQHALRKQELFEEKAKELVEAAAKRKLELTETRKALVKMKQAYSALQDALNRGGGLRNFNSNTSNGTGNAPHSSSNNTSKNRKSRRKKSSLSYPKTGELGPFLTTIENLWEQLQYCDYAYMLSTRRYRANSPKHVLQISSERLSNAEQCIEALCKVFEQNVSSISSLLPISGHRKISTPVQKLVNLLLCFSSEIVKLRKRVNDYTEALLDETFSKSDKFENEWNEQKVLVSVDIVDSMKEESRGSNTNDNDVDHNITINDEDNDIDGTSMKDNEVGNDGVKIE